MMKYLLFFLLTLVPVKAYSVIDCQSVPDCEDLGFSKKDVADCPEDGYIYCPFDLNYKKCINSCEKMGFTKDDKSEWCPQIVRCLNGEAYTLCASLDPYGEYSSECGIGDVYYADGTCSSADIYTVNNKSKIAIGVVYALSEEAGSLPYITEEALMRKSKHGRIISLHDIKFDAINYHEISQEYPYEGATTYFGLDGTNVEFTAYKNIAEGFAHRDRKLYDGIYNTNILLETNPANSLCDGTYEIGKDPIGAVAQYCQATAAMGVRAFYPPELSAGHGMCGAGKWFLPSLGDLLLLFGANETRINNTSCTLGMTGKTIEKVNATLDALSKKQASWEPIGPAYYAKAGSKLDNLYWSSTQYDADNQWTVSMEDGCRKVQDRSVRGPISVRAALIF